jgi:hypothetical protein
MGVNEKCPNCNPDDEWMCPNCVTPWKCNGPHSDGRESCISHLEPIERMVRFETALRQIAMMDWRGNMPNEVRIAREALGL